MVHRRLAAVLLAAVAAAAATACGGTPTAEQPAKLRVVATTTHLTDLARVVAGEQATVRGLLPRNADPHDFEPRPSDIEALADADVILRSGGEVDEWIEDAIEAAGSDAEVVTAIEGVPNMPEGDPHWWQNAFSLDRGFRWVAQAFLDADPNNEGAYERRVEAYTAQLDRLDVAIARCMRRIPREQRKLVTTHDAFAVYAQRYGVEVVGTVIPSRSTRGQPSAGQTATLVDLIKREGVKAIFPEQTLEPKVEAAIARETGAKIGDPLYADALGPEGSEGDTAAKALAANTRALAEGFTGRPSTCRFPGA